MPRAPLLRLGAARLTTVMPHGCVVLQGAHVRLEPLDLHHLPALAAVGLDPAIWRFMVTDVADEGALRRWVEQALRERDAGTSLPFATVERAGDTVVGSTRFGNIDAANRRVEIGWTWIAPAWQRTVVNTEAKLLMLTHAFEHLGCERVEFKTDRLNERSRQAILRLGAVEEGILRHHMLTSSGRWRDSVYYSILADEWPAVRQHLQRRASAE